MAAPKGYKKAPKYKIYTGFSTSKKKIEADREAYKFSGFKTRVVKEGKGYQLYIKE